MYKELIELLAKGVGFAIAIMLFMLAFILMIKWIIFLIGVFL